MTPRPKKRFSQNFLIDKNIVKDTWEAFSKFLSKGAPAHVPKQKLDLKSALNIIHAAKGVAVLAHPISLFYSTYQQYENAMDEMIEMGKKIKVMMVTIFSFLLLFSPILER